MYRLSPEDEAGEGEKRQVLPKKVTEEIAKAIIEKIRQAKRPVINAGNGIRLAGAHETFLKVAEKLVFRLLQAGTVRTVSGMNIRYM